MDLDLLRDGSTGSLVRIHGTDPRSGPWEHQAYVPDPLPTRTSDLSARTFTAVASARAALASLDSSAARLPNPALLRRPALRREAQSTSALEGTFAPLEEVLAADEDDPSEGDLGEVLIGSSPGAPAQDARFVPGPPGPELEQRLRDAVGWMNADHDGELDPVVAAAMAHHQLETLHPFNDGNGRIGRLLIVLHLMTSGTLVEPTLTVSPWFEARRGEHHDRLLDVSARGGWDAWIRFFADGLAASATDTQRSLLDLLRVQGESKDKVRSAGLRGDRAMLLVDHAVARPIFTVAQVQRHLAMTYTGANRLVSQLVDASVLRQYGDAVYNRELTAPDVLAVLLR